MQDSMTPARGENSSINHIDELAFVPADDLETAPLLPEEEKQQIERLTAELNTDRNDFAKMVEDSLNTVKAANSHIFTDEKSTPEQKGKAFAVLQCIQRIEDPELLIKEIGIYQDFGSFTYTETLLKRFRSLCRTAHITGLDIKPLVASIRAHKDREFRQKLVLMLNVVMTYVTREPKQIASRVLFVRFQLAIIKYAVKLGITPVLASRLYDSYHALYTGKK